MTTNFFRSMLSVIGSILLLTNYAHSAEVNWEQGARRAWVLQVYESKPAHEITLTCFENLTEEDFKNRHFVKVHYRHIRRFIDTVAEAPQEMHVKPGDEVEFIPEKCMEGKISTIIQILESKNNKTN